MLFRSKKHRQSLPLCRDTFNTYNNLLITWILYIDLLDFAQNEYECAFEIADLKSCFIKVPYISLINIVLLYIFAQEPKLFLDIKSIKYFLSIIRNQLHYYLVEFRVSFLLPHKPILSKLLFLYQLSPKS